jgi:hypothetical protein
LLRRSALVAPVITLWVKSVIEMASVPTQDVAVNPAHGAFEGFHVYGVVLQSVIETNPVALPALAHRRAFLRNIVAPVWPC